MGFTICRNSPPSEIGTWTWFAAHDVQGGRKLHEQIDEAIRLDNQLESEWVKTEIAALASLAIAVDQLQQLCLSLARGRQLAIQPLQGVGDDRHVRFEVYGFHAVDPDSKTKFCGRCVVGASVRSACTVAENRGGPSPSP